MYSQLRINHLQSLLVACNEAISAQERIINNAPEEGDLYALSLESLLAQRKKIQEDLAYLSKSEPGSCSVAFCQCGSPAVISLNAQPSAEMIDELSEAARAGCEIRQVSVEKIRELAVNTTCNCSCSNGTSCCKEAA